MNHMLKYLLDSKIPVGDRFSYFDKNELSIYHMIDSSEDEDRLLFYSFLVDEYCTSLISEGQYVEALATLQRIEIDFRRMKMSDKKMEVLERFQFKLAYLQYLNSEFLESRQSFEQLMHCRPGNATYKKYWAKNEAQIAKNFSNKALLALLPLLIVNIIFMVKSSGMWPYYVVVFLLISIFIVFAHRVYWDVKGEI